MRQYIRVYLQTDGLTIRHIHTNSRPLGSMEYVGDEKAPLAIDLEVDIDSHCFIDAVEMYKDVVKIGTDHKPIFNNNKCLKNMHVTVLKSLHKRW